jgi:hypothetical protein
MFPELISFDVRDLAPLHRFVCSSDPPLPITNSQLVLFQDPPKTLFIIHVPTHDPDDLHRTFMMASLVCISVTMIESHPNQLLVETTSPVKLSWLFPHSVPVDRASLLRNFCNPLNSLHFMPGTIVRLSDPQFCDDAAQIVAVDPAAAEVTMRHYPLVDYALMLREDVYSQKALNNQMPINYHAPIDRFNRPFLARSKAKLGEGVIHVGEWQLPTTIWDGEAYIETFMYREHVSLTELRSMNLRISQSEFERFERGCQSVPYFINRDFLRRMDKARPSSVDSEFQDSDRMCDDDPEILRRELLRNRHRGQFPQLRHVVPVSSSSPSQDVGRLSPLEPSQSPELDLRRIPEAPQALRPDLRQMPEVPQAVRPDLRRIPEAPQVLGPDLRRMRKAQQKPELDLPRMPESSQ